MLLQTGVAPDRKLGDQVNGGTKRIAYLRQGSFAAGDTIVDTGGEIRFQG